MNIYNRNMKGLLLQKDYLFVRKTSSDKVADNVLNY